MKNRIEFEKAYEPVSDMFHARVEKTLLIIGKEETVKHRKITKVWVLAAVFILIIGTAFAAGSGFGLMDFLKNDESGVLPLENADTAIQNSLLVYEHENVIWSVDQAVYDGECVRALVKIAPVDSEKYALSFPFMDDLPLKIANRNTEDELASKLALPVGFPELEPAGDSQMVDIDRTVIQGAYLSENGEYTMYIFCPITLRQIETAPDQLVLWLCDGNDMRCPAAFTLDKCANDKAVYLDSDTTLSDATIKNVVLTQTPFASYLDITYTCARSGPDMILNAETTYYATQNGAFLHTEPDCSGMQNALELTFEEAAAMNKDHLCPVCAGGSLEAIKDTTTGGQLDFSICDTALPFFFGGHETEFENGFKKTYIFSAEESFPEEITLNLLRKGEFTGDSLMLSRVR